MTKEDTQQAVMETLQEEYGPEYVSLAVANTRNSRAMSPLEVARESGIPTDPDRAGEIAALFAEAANEQTPDLLQRFKEYPDS